jgi:UDPglucose 6-dehydrogenase
MIDSTNPNQVNLMDAPLAVVGLGHVGLPTALGLAELGWSVVGADDDASKVALIRAGHAPFYEAGLRELLVKHLATGKFRPVDDAQAAVQAAPIIFICVGTPQREDGQADLTQVEAVARVVAHNLNGYKLIVEKSTVPAVTAQWLKKAILRYCDGKSERLAASGPSVANSAAGVDVAAPSMNFEVASNPEFLQEGKALENFFRPERVVCGVETDKAREILTEIYRPLHCPILVTDIGTAELIKHAANAFLATKISFINMVADLCEKVGADIAGVARGIGLDSRIGPQFLEAGIGYGGYCFPKDLRAFIHLAEEYGVDFSLLRTVERINQQRVEGFVRKVRQAVWVLEGKTLAVLGLAFKPGTDDIREAPSLKIISALRKHGAVLRLYDPQAMPNMRRVFAEETGSLIYCSSAYEAAQGAHALLLLTEWDEFRALNLPKVRELMEFPIIVDGRNLFDPHQVCEAGFEYVSIGRHGVRHPALRSSGQTVAA